MATQTANVGLTLPAGSEKYSLGVVNENSEKIDKTLGTLLDAVGVGTGTGLTEKIGENTDTEAGTVFGDLNIIKGQTEQNGEDIAEVKTVADGNANKLTALQTTAGNTKTVVDVINTNIGTVKQNTETLKTTANGISAKVENINANVSGNGTKLDTLADKADVISGQVQTVGNNVSAVGGKVDTAISLLNELKTALANANTNIATLLTQSNGVKAIVSGQITTPPTNPYKIDATIPDTMNAEKVVILATAHSTASNIDSGIAWVRDGHIVTFAANNKVISYQFIEFY